MTKKDLSALLHKLDGVAIGEGEQFLDAGNTYPKIAYWEYVWTDTMSSGDDYQTVVTYQVSFLSKRPRDPQLIRLKQLLNSAGLHPTIYTEYNAGQNKAGEYHSYFSIDVVEDLDG